MEELLRMEGISKSFSGVRVLNRVELTVKHGEVHALLGENGAGKSTLIKILGGAYTKDEGTIYIEGNKTEITSVESARSHGIRVIHQELMLIPYMTVAENIFLGQEPKTKRGTVDTAKMNRDTAAFLKEMELDIQPDEQVGRLNIAKQQMVEIARAISFGAKIIVMDEPTSSLTDTEVEVLFKAIRRLKEKGMRDGEDIATVVTKDTTHDHLVSLMVGRSLGDLYDKHNHSGEETVLSVHHLAAGKEVRDVSFELKKGEVLGFSGLVGSGRSETMEALFGLRRKDSGEILVNGKKVQIKNVKDAMNCGLGLVPEDRKKEGIFAVQGIRFNTTIEVLDQFLKGGTYSREKEISLIRTYVDQVMETKYAGIEQPIGRLSGGNQQKVIISRWLLATEKILILDEPTRGIDVKTKADIYHLIDRLTAEGLSVIFISSEMPELINMCDRIVVMNHGRTTGVLSREEFTQERIMELSTKEL